MARSKNSNSPFKELKKNIRAEAVKNGINYAEAIDRRNACKDTQKIDLSRALSRRNPGRMDGWQWRGSTFISPHQVDNGDFRTGEADSDEEAFAEGDTYAHPKDRVVCLMDFARPAKRIAPKDRFELVGRPKADAELSDDEFDLLSVVTEEWEALSEDMYERDVAHEVPKVAAWGGKPYAEVLKASAT
ncbi:hypothetical protein HDZ31DRAFT_66723 [Schizophyllum fasciatum]